MSCNRCWDLCSTTLLYHSTLLYSTLLYPPLLPYNSSYYSCYGDNHDHDHGHHSSTFALSCFSGDWRARVAITLLRRFVWWPLLLTVSYLCCCYQRRQQRIIVHLSVQTRLPCHACQPYPTSPRSTTTTTTTTLHASQQQ